MMQNENVAITFSADEALVLSDWLEQVIDNPEFSRLIGENKAVWVPLMKISGVLEHGLTVIFSPDYADQLRMAQERLIDSLGEFGRT
ncbi:hypothetical protein [Nonomuraea turcica]|uniref:hypothetical protein n=1 Tax=Nonomuraea sp. G32 TaxID=3067274 RepID=UPI00273A8139|nr:hypothetical protein [Nonomuraea sp. G32]MDP4505249.1 hypothetical protein [Nonomuraea sp. G32]